ncbi:MAG: nuclear transport factor 2 family protein [Usitatibacteraceae bacterium]
MSATENKRHLQNVFNEMAKGNTAPFLNCLAEDICWRFMGSTKWTKTYRGKKSVLQDLLAPLAAQFASQYTSTPLRLIAEDDYVVAELQGNVMCKSNKPYNNRYCYVCRLADGQIAEITEYMDTALADAVLADPA